MSTSRGTLGICVAGGAAADDYVIIAYGGAFNAGATLVAGTAYYVSDTAGGIKPMADLDPGDIPLYLGTAYTTSLMFLGPVNGITALA
jgi:hypothetical protein